MTKHIFVTGGVVSSLGKGLTSASIGMLLESRGLSVRMQKLDPYLNVNLGMMSPAQHGEVYVLDDGIETDLDLGQYERFTQSRLTRDSSWTTGKIYSKLLKKESQGAYFGQTVQVIPHVTNEIKECIRRLASDDTDVVITEIGGTVGDIESLPFLEAIRQFSLEVGKENCLYIHLTLVPYLKAARELKTKPTQHSVGNLRQIGIQPDFVVCRTEQTLSEDDARKIALFCNVPFECVIEERDAQSSIYEVPMTLLEHRLDSLIVQKLGLKCNQADLTEWQEILNRLRNPSQEVTIAVVGNYTRLKDAYKSIYEALDHGGVANHAQVRFRRIQSDSIDREDVQRTLEGADGILVAGGFGEDGIEGLISAVKIARERQIPFLGICLGMQCAAIEYARNVLNMPEVGSTEFDRHCETPLVCLMDEERKAAGEEVTRLGSKPTVLIPGTKIAGIYGATDIAERYRHRYELNNAYREQLENGGMVVAATNADGKLIEALELPSHPWFIAVQYHPQFKSRPVAPHPLFVDFIKAALAQSDGAKRG